MPKQAGHFDHRPERFPGGCHGWPSGATGRMRRLAGRGAAVLAALVLAACSQAPNPPLTVGLNAWVGNDPLVLAREKKLMDPQAIKIVELPSEAEVLRNFRNGLLDAASLTLDETLRLADEGVDVRLVGVMDASNGADVVMVDPGIRSLADLRGQRIAVESTAVGGLVLQRLLLAAGLRASDVEVVDLDAPEHLEALRNHRVSAAVSYEPIAGELRAAGYQGLFDTRQMQGDVMNVLVVQGRLMAGRSEQVEAMLVAWEGGLTAQRAHPQEAAQLLAPGGALTTDGYLAATSRLTQYTNAQSLEWLTGATPRLAQDAQPLVSTLQAMDMLKKPPDWARLIDAEPVRRVLERGAHS